MAGARRCILVVEDDSETAEQLMETSPRAAATRPAAQKLRGHGQPQRRRALAKNAPWRGCLRLSVATDHRSLEACTGISVGRRSSTRRRRPRRGNSCSRVTC